METPPQAGPNGSTSVLPGKRRHIARRFWWLLLLIVILPFVVVNTAFYLLQEKFVFVPARLSPEELSALNMADKDVEEITIKAADNTTLRGWFVKHPGPDKSPLIIYCGGNAEDVACLIPATSRTAGWSWALVNYRGYGQSEGSPNESNMYRDAISIYEYFAGRPEIDAARIVVFGRSLGTGVAVYVAAQRPAKGVVLVSPYDSIASVAQERMLIRPIALLLRNRFEAISHAPSIKVPMLALIAPDDRVISVEHSYRLIEKWGGQTTVIAIEGKAHDTINDSPLYWQSITSFLSQF